MSTSIRHLSLVSASLWDLKSAPNTTDGPLIFPRYCGVEGNKANYASNALNKWLKAYVLESFVIYSFRHSLLNELKAVRCPNDIINRIGS